MHKWKNKFFIIVVSMLLVSSQYSHASMCMNFLNRPGNFEHIFVAKITQATYKHWDSPGTISKYQGVVTANFEIEEIIKGDPTTIPYFETHIPTHHDRNWNSPPIMPTGYSIIVFAKENGPQEFDFCAKYRFTDLGTRQCRIYEIKKALGTTETTLGKCENEQRERLAWHKKKNDILQTIHKKQRDREIELKRIIEEAGYSFVDLKLNNRK